MDLRNYFGLKAIPFSSDLKPNQLFLRPCMEEISSKMAFAIQNGMYFTLIGEVGAGKSTAIRYSLSKLSAKAYAPIPMIGGAWSFTELLRQCMQSIGISTRTSQQSRMLKEIKDCFASIRESGRTPLLVIDECQLFNNDVFSQLHILSQGDLSGRSIPVVLCGQELLFEKLSSPMNKPLYSRVLDGYNLSGLSMEECSRYIKHLVCNIAGGKDDLFEEQAMIAIYQASAGIPRNVNEICLKAMAATMAANQGTVTLDMVRIALKKWWER